MPLTGVAQKAVSVLQAAMDRRVAFRLAIVVAGMFLADDRRTASAWFVAAGVQDDWDRFYDCLISVGRTSGASTVSVSGSASGAREARPKSRIFTVPSAVTIRLWGLMSR